MANKNKCLVLFFLLIFTGLTTAKAQLYRVSLLTCDPGAELYSAFGHSAIRVLDLSSGRDLVFNYGTFDFDTPFFLYKFARRTLDYQLSVTTYANFIQNYAQEKRSVREQILNTSAEQNEYIVEFLQVNYLPDRRKYRYDFFFDNCATRIRDAMELSLGDDLVWNDLPDSTESKTFRNLIDEYILDNVWADFGIDLALGAVIDREASAYDAQFLPDYMEQAFARAEIVGDGPTRPLVKESRVLMEFPPAQASSWGLLNPYVLTWVIAIAFGIVTFLGFKRGRLYLGWDVGLFGLLGILGVLIFLLWFATEHSATKWNWNLLWAFPGHLILAWALLAKQVKPWVRRYLLAALILADAAVVFWILGWQSFHPSLVPLLLVVILRTNYLYYNIERMKALKTK
ncbi:lipoprotein N-acyltransferase Lnb domain-containing protein [Algoriphagus namhaensis]